ncbi:MAG TPA: DNA-formamidopyrimidine glycosylase family protein [Acidimicrobiales bacterium]|nr:DNA-formamidopyrimidine glycosylase family protein [Acidimicrobiales bacterium]
MPELPEVEAYRRLAEGALHRPVATVAVSDPRFVRGTTTARRLTRVLVGASFAAARRTGKLLVLDLDGSTVDGGHRLGIRFGMTGRLVVDGRAGVDRLVYSGDYSADGSAARWDRFALGFTDGGSLVVHDPRLLGGVILDPDESALGPDALGVTLAQLRDALAGSAAPLKARLMDQGRLAGVGNLIADEVLWRASLAPHRRAGSLSPAELRRLHRHLRVTLDELSARGGSHLGDLMPARRRGGRCRRDGAALVRSTVGGRTSWWCPRHQT